MRYLRTRYIFIAMISAIILTLAAYFVSSRDGEKNYASTCVAGKDGVIGTSTTTVEYSGHIVHCTVAKSGFYEVVAYGADGGGVLGGEPFLGETPGNGAMVAGEAKLTAGEKITILVGGAGRPAVRSQSNGGSGSGGGGGGTYLLVGNDKVLMIAAGGGGVSDTNGMAGLPGYAGQDDITPGFSGGGDNSASDGGDINGGGSGGGLNGNGNSMQFQEMQSSCMDCATTEPPIVATGGLAFINGGDGGRGGTTSESTSGNGGFGGGGGGGITSGGGGGGYSGGNGGDDSMGGAPNGGDGGRSFLAYNLQHIFEKTGGNDLHSNGNGEVIFRYMAGGAVTNIDAKHMHGSFWILRVNGTEDPVGDQMLAVIAHVAMNGKLLGMYPLGCSVYPNGTDQVINPSGNLLTVTYNGISKLNRTTGKVSNFFLPQTLSGYQVDQIAVDQEGDIWSSLSNINALEDDEDMSGESSPPIVPDKLVEMSRANQLIRVVNVGMATISDIAVDRQDDIWVGGDSGLVKLSNTGQVLWRKIGHGSYMNIVFDSHDNAWVDRENLSYGDNEIFKLNNSGVQLLKLKVTDASGWLSVDHDGRVWVGTDNGDMDIYSADGKLLKSFKLISNIASALEPHGYVWSLVPPYKFIVPVVGGATEQHQSTGSALLVAQDDSGMVVRRVTLPYQPTPPNWMGLGKDVEYDPRSR